VNATAATAGQAEAITAASAMWRARGATGMGLDTLDSIELVFAKGNGAVRGHYDDEAGLIYINDNLPAQMLPIVIAHELGHAFGLEHEDDGADSLMVRGNTTIAPTELDEANLAVLWGTCQ
jgi:predicted Zn-dependent protease